MSVGLIPVLEGRSVCRFNSSPGRVQSPFEENQIEFRKKSQLRVKVK